MANKQVVLPINASKIHNINIAMYIYIGNISKIRSLQLKTFNHQNKKDIHNNILTFIQTILTMHNDINIILILITLYTNASSILVND